MPRGFYFADAVSALHAPVDGGKADARGRGGDRLLYLLLRVDHGRYQKPVRRRPGHLVEGSVAHPDGSPVQRAAELAAGTAEEAFVATPAELTVTAPSGHGLPSSSQCC